jgi:hypothetical protein
MRTPSRLALAILATALAAPGLQAQRTTVQRPEAGPPPSRGTMPPPRPPTPPSPSPTPSGSRSGWGQTSGPNGGTDQRPSTWRQPSSSQVIVPRATPRCQHWPDSAFWRTRDLFKEIQWMSRQGFIPVSAAGDATELSGSCFFPAGWRAYSFVVPAKEKLNVRLHHSNEGWFRLVMVDRWGQLREGMLQNVIHIATPEVSFISPLATATTVYVIVDDPGWMSTSKNPFTLTVTRSWDPAKTPVPALQPVTGIWAQVEIKDVKPGEEKPSKAAPAA